MSPAEEGVSVSVNAGELRGGKPALTLVAPGALDAENSLAEPAVVRCETGDVAVRDGAVTFRPRPLPVAVPRLE